MSKHIGWTAVVALGLSAAACQGRIADDGRHAPSESGAAGHPAGAGGAGPNGGAAQPTAYAPARARRLSALEITNAATDVFLGGKPVAATMPADVLRHRYDNFFESLSVSLDVADALQTYAQAVAAEAIKNTALTACTGSEESSCLHDFLSRNVLRAYRRPMTPDDEATLTSVFSTARKGFDYPTSLGFVIEAMLQSPFFLFRTELGRERNDGVAHLDPFEVASSLSFFLWRSTPDDRLLQQAASGDLVTSAGLAAEANRLLADPRAHATLKDFVSQWLETNTLTAVQQASAYKTFTPALAASMQAEIAAISDKLLWNPGGIPALFSTTRTFADAGLAKVYGVTAPTTGQAEVALDPAQRTGVLTMPGVIASHSRPEGFSPVFLGRFVRTRLLCQPLPDPPANVPPLPAAKPGTTTRDRFAQHLSDPTCSACHKAMDPIGFSFEQYDGTGAYRGSTGDGGELLTGKGELTGTDVDSAVTGAADLASKLSKSTLLPGCFVSHLLELAVGRDATSTPRAATDEDAIAHAVGDGAPNQLRIEQVLAALVASDAFVLRDARALP